MQNPELQIAHRWTSTTGSNTLTIPNTVDGERRLIVVDWIRVSVTTSGPSTITLSFGGVQIGNVIIAGGLGGDAFIQQDFTGGLPIWGNANSDGVQFDDPTIVIAGASITARSIVAGFHIVRQSDSRN